MKPRVNQLLYTLFIMLVIDGCGQTSDNSNSNNTPLKVATENYCEKLDGSIFQYKYWDDKPEGYGFTIMFHCKSDSVKAMMLGIDPEGEEGVYFFKSDLENIRVNSDSISFTCIQGKLYKKPFTLDNYNKEFSNEKLGFSKNEILYSGKIMTDSIVFLCDNTNGDCFADTMIFTKKK